MIIVDLDIEVYFLDAVLFEKSEHQSFFPLELFLEVQLVGYALHNLSPARAFKPEQI